MVHSGRSWSGTWASGPSKRQAINRNSRFFNRAVSGGCRAVSTRLPTDRGTVLAMIGSGSIDAQLVMGCPGRCGRLHHDRLKAAHVGTVDGLHLVAHLGEIFANRIVQ